MMWDVRETFKDGIFELKRDVEKGSYLFPHLDDGASSPCPYSDRILKSRVKAVENENEITYAEYLKLLFGNTTAARISFTVKLIHKETINDHFDEILDGIRSEISDVLENGGDATALLTRLVDCLIALGRKQEAVETAGKFEFKHDILSVLDLADSAGADPVSVLAQWAALCNFPLSRAMARLHLCTITRVDTIQAQLAGHADFLDVQDAFILATKLLGFSSLLTLRLYEKWIVQKKANLPSTNEIMSCTSDPLEKIRDERLEEMFNPNHELLTTYRLVVSCLPKHQLSKMKQKNAGRLRMVWLASLALNNWVHAQSFVADITERIDEAALTKDIFSLVGAIAQVVSLCDECELTHLSTEMRNIQNGASVKHLFSHISPNVILKPSNRDESGEQDDEATDVQNNVEAIFQFIRASLKKIGFGEARSLNRRLGISVDIAYNLFKIMHCGIDAHLLPPMEAQPAMTPGSAKKLLDIFSRDASVLFTDKDQNSRYAKAVRLSPSRSPANLEAASMPEPPHSSTPVASSTSAVDTNGRHHMRPSMATPSNSATTMQRASEQRARNIDNAYTSAAKWDQGRIASTEAIFEQSEQMAFLEKHNGARSMEPSAHPLPPSSGVLPTQCSISDVTRDLKSMLGLGAAPPDVAPLQTSTPAPPVAVVPPEYVDNEGETSDPDGAEEFRASPASAAVEVAPSFVGGEVVVSDPCLRGVQDITKTKGMASSEEEKRLEEAYIGIEVEARSVAGSVLTDDLHSVHNASLQVTTDETMSDPEDPSAFALISSCEEEKTLVESPGQRDLVEMEVTDDDSIVSEERGPAPGVGKHEKTDEPTIAEPVTPNDDMTVKEEMDAEVMVSNKEATKADVCEGLAKEGVTTAKVPVVSGKAPSSLLGSMIDSLADDDTLDAEMGLVNNPPVSLPSPPRASVPPSLEVPVTSGSVTDKVFASASIGEENAVLPAAARAESKVAEDDEGLSDDGWNEVRSAQCSHAGSVAGSHCSRLSNAPPAITSSQPLATTEKLCSTAAVSATKAPAVTAVKQLEEKAKKEVKPVRMLDSDKGGWGDSPTTGFGGSGFGGQASSGFGQTARGGASSGGFGSGSGYGGGGRGGARGGGRGGYGGGDFGAGGGGRGGYGGGGNSRGGSRGGSAFARGRGAPRY